MKERLKWLVEIITLKQFRIVAKRSNDLHQKIENINHKTKILLDAVNNNRLVGKEE